MVYWGCSHQTVRESGGAGFIYNPKGLTGDNCYVVSDGTGVDPRALTAQRPRRDTIFKAEAKGS
jgi:hypothetical protein